MQPRNLLGVIVRTGGLVLLFFSASDLFHFVARPFGFPSHYSVGADLAAMCFYFGTGVLLTRRAEWIVQFAYGPDAAISN